MAPRFHPERRTSARPEHHARRHDAPTAQSPNASARTAPSRTAPSPTAPSPTAPSPTAPSPTAPPTPAPSFADLGVPAPIAAALGAAGLATPFPIQAAALPDALGGRDVLGRARTGSGKTIAFSVPVVAALRAPGHRRSPGRPGGLILVPTRELAVQVSRTIGPLAASVGLRIATVHGGVSPAPQKAALRRGADIVVATPGRLEDLIAQGQCRLDHVMITVLDEADLMVDLGFLPAVRRLMDQTPAAGQRLLFSATLDDAVADLAAKYMHEPAAHSIDAPDDSPASLDHHLFTVQGGDKAAVVAELASGPGRNLLFTRTKHGAQKLARQLNAAGIPAVDLHANLAQRARERNLAAFADGTVGVLVATDIAARGVHVDGINLVVHVDPPAEHKAYLHRSGRTARAGAAGVVVTIATPDQARAVTTLLRRAKVRPHAADVVPGDDRITVVSGGPGSPRRTAPRPVGEKDRHAASGRPAPRVSGERDRHAASGRSAPRVNGEKDRTAASGRSAPRVSGERDRTAVPGRAASAKSRPRRRYRPGDDSGRAGGAVRSDRRPARRQPR